MGTACSQAQGKNDTAAGIKTTKNRDSVKAGRVSIGRHPD
jgi:hypothetical protein